ncbi:hypothetical protein L0128_12715 [candidate division KSB1 bacterium]|nr:hypothetical protein [candidate division KSB1 bacterium]
MRRYSRQFSVSGFILWLLMGWQGTWGQTTPQLPPPAATLSGSRFESRLKHYLDLKTKDFITKMAVKEQFLLQMIQNLSQEVTFRKTQGTITENIGLAEAFQEQEQLIAQYSTELNDIMKLINEIELLEHEVARSENFELVNEIHLLKDNLKTTLENRKLYKKDGHHQNIAIELIREYGAELDSVLDIYESLVKFEQQAQSRNDLNTVMEIQVQKQRIVHIIGSYSPDGTPAINEQMAQASLDESEKIVKILTEIEKVNLLNPADTARHVPGLEQVKSTLVDSIDERLIKLSGTTPSEDESEAKLTDLFNEWRAKKMRAYQTRLIQYRTLYSRLLESGSEADRSRMLERATGDAVLNYSARNFDLAELQFEDILKNFTPYFPQLDGAIFYLGETNYARSYYDAAYQNFDYLLNHCPDSKFLGLAIWKQMLISYTYGWKSKFLNLLEKLNRLPILLTPEELGKAHYLAGYMYAASNDFTNARNYLGKINKESPYYFPAQYLLGIVYVNLDNYAKAKSTFEMVAKISIYPWTDPNLTTLRNEAIIRLGFLHFQRSEYQKAIEILSNVSKGFQSYDQSLMVQAWAKLKSGKYEESIQQVNHLLSDYLSSNYTYEALILSAQCKKILDRPDEAKQDLKYINAAHNIRNLTDEYHAERRRILEQTHELTRLENLILDRQDKHLFAEVSKIRNAINEALLTFNNQKFSNSQLIEGYNDERKAIVYQIQNLDQIIKQAGINGRRDVVATAEKQKERLIHVLETFKADKSVTNINAFIEHPLATKEGGIQYRRGIVKNMYQDIVAEKKRLERVIQETSQLIAKTDSTGKIAVTTVNVEILEEDLQDLRNQLNRLEIWLANNPVEDVNSGFDKWVDVSGFGMSDLDFSSIQDKDQIISVYSKNIDTINKLLARKKQTIEQQLSEFDQKMRKIEKTIDEDRVRLERMERKKYFETLYFDTKDKENQRKTGDEELERILEEELKRTELKENLKKELKDQHE